MRLKWTHFYFSCEVTSKSRSSSKNNFFNSNVFNSNVFLKWGSIFAYSIEEVEVHFKTRSSSKTNFFYANSNVIQSTLVHSRRSGSRTCFNQITAAAGPSTSPGDGPALGASGAKLPRSPLPGTMGPALFALLQHRRRPDPANPVYHHLPRTY